MTDATAAFILDPRLAADTVLVADLPLCRACLMDDARFAWLILVPRRPDMTEIDDLAPAEQVALWSEAGRAMAALRATVPFDKFNIGALGNIVRQLHLHVIARRTTDAAWPGPAWGAGPRQPYAPATRAALCTRLGQAMRGPR